MPPLPSKRMLEESDDEDYDYDHDHDIEPEVKRQRENSPSDIYDYEEEEPEELEEPESMRQPEEHQAQDHDQNADKSVADEIVGLMMPRLETHLQQLVNGVALRMLNALGTRLNRLESRMEEMQREWKRTVAGGQFGQASYPQRVEGQQYRQPQHYQSRQPHRITPEDSETHTIKTPQAAHSTDPLNNFLQEAARAADSPDISYSSHNRKQPFLAQVSKMYSGPPLKRSSCNGMYERSPLSALPPDPTIQPEHVPQYHLDRSLQTIVDLWHEFFVGSETKPAINELDQKYGSMWRWKNSKETTYYGLRRVIIDEITSRVEARCPDTAAATGDVWLTVCEEMDHERVAAKASLSQYIQEIKRRERLRSPPRKPPRQAVYPEAPPEQPILSRTTASVAELWVEWFEGKRDSSGYTIFPSVIELNARFGDMWRKPKTAEYAMYLKRRCIIDMALQKILETGGDWEQTKQKVVEDMDVERTSEGLSLAQYNHWAREKKGYHALRTRVPMEMIDFGGLPQGFGEGQAQEKDRQARGGERQTQSGDTDNQEKERDEVVEIPVKG